MADSPLCLRLLLLSTIISVYQVDALQTAGCGISLWTVNDKQTMAACPKYGAGIIINHPDVAVALKNK